MNYSIIFAVVFAYGFLLLKNIYNLMRIKKLKKQYINFKKGKKPLPHYYQAECRVLFWIADINQLVKVANTNRVYDVLNNFPNSQSDSLCINCFEAAISRFSYKLRCTYSPFAFLNHLIYTICNFDIKLLDRFEMLLRCLLSCAGMLASAFFGTELHKLLAPLFDSLNTR